MYVTLCLFCSPWATSFYPQPFGCSLRCFNNHFDSFPFLVPFKSISARALHRDLVMKSLKSTSIGIQLAFHTFLLYISLEVHHICTFARELLVHVPPMGLSILISIFSLFCLKILVYLGVMMFGQYGLGTSILSLNQPLVPSLLPVTVHSVYSLLLVWLPPITKTIQVRRTRHAGPCWRSRDELINDVILWTPT